MTDIREEALGTALQRKLGNDEVRHDLAHRAAYASDASNYRQTPISVVVPRTLDSALAALEVCRTHGAPVLARGGGTSMCGQTVNEAVVFDFSAHCRRIIALDPGKATAVVEPGVVCDQLIAAAQSHGLTFAPDPSTHSRCTLGGMIANNSCGAHSVMAGKTLENVEAIEVVTYDGCRFWAGRTSEAELEEIIRAGGRQGEIYQALRNLRDRYADLIRAKYPKIKRRVSGYNLDQLLPENGFNVARALVGSEGTCAITLQAEVRLVPSPAFRVMLVLGFPDIYTAADAVAEYEAFGPIAIEGLDRHLIRGLQARDLCADEIAMLPAGDGWVMLEFGGDDLEGATRKAQRASDYFAQRPHAGPARPVPSARLIEDPAQQRRIWSIRETGASATQLSLDPGRPDPQVGWEDAAVDPHRLGDYLRAFQALVDRYGYQTNLFGHFGDGCVHSRITFDLRSVEGVQTWREFTREAAQLVVDFGGSLSGEHGDGQAKAEFLPLMFGEELMGAMREFKRIWDPQDRLNPGKLVSARGEVYRIDHNLRAGPGYKTISIATRFQFRSAEGDGFQRAVERCVGMGKCRSMQGGAMCPSYRATREERFSTRGRSRLLWEMLQGKLIKDGWKSREVKQALDTCLSCKSCRSECPTHTDMASYKAEFLSHYYESNRRPLQAWLMGRIGDWAPWASSVPRLFNAMTQAPGLAWLAKRVAGVPAGRSLPRLAGQSFRQTVEGARPIDGRPRVLLWVDTFCEHFHPEIASAAWSVLGHAGMQVVLPPKDLCCGRPLYDFGFLEQARRRLSDILDRVAPLFEGPDAPIALVGLEPGCLSVFKDELLKFFPDDPRAIALSTRTKMFGDFLSEIDYRPPSYAVDVAVHAHCHQRALFGVKGEEALLTRMGARWRLLESGCCGMAGSFGFHREHNALSRAIGEQVLFPALRALPAETFIVTNGFSCREQIAYGVGTRALHLAELLWEAVLHAAGKPDDRSASLEGIVSEATAGAASQSFADGCPQPCPR